MNVGWRNPNTVGAAYRVITTDGKTSVHPSHDKYRIIEGDTLLCLAHTGDCYYLWALLMKHTENDYDEYFFIDRVYQSYGVNEETMIKKATGPQKLLEFVSSYIMDPSRMSFLIPHPESKLEAKKNEPCHFCGREGPKPDRKEEEADNAN